MPITSKRVTVHSLANEIYAQLEIRKYEGQEDRWFLKEGSPDWMYSVIVDAGYKVSTDLDTTYDMSMRILGALADVASDDSDEDDCREAIQEIEPDVYTSDLTKWLNSNNNHVYYLDEAMKEYGDSLDAFQALSIAQKLQIEEFGELILAALLGLVESFNEDLEDEDDEDTEEVDKEDYVNPLVGKRFEYTVPGKKRAVYEVMIFGIECGCRNTEDDTWEFIPLKTVSTLIYNQ